MMINAKTTIDELLAAFFLTQTEGVRGVRNQRIVRVERRLRECLETDGYGVLVNSDRIRLEAERVFDPARAFVRMTDASDLVFALPIFLSPAWLMTDSLDQRAQLTLVDKLTRLVLAYRLVDRDEFACPLLDIRCGIDRARSAIRQLPKPEPL